MLDVLTAEEDEQRNGDGPEDVHHRGVDGEGADGAQIGFEQTPRCLTEASHLPGFHAEGLHNADAGDGFVQQVMDFGELVLPFASGGADPVSNPAGGQDDERHENNQDPGQPAAKSHYYDSGEKEGKKLLKKFGQHAGHGELHALHVIDDGRQQRAGGMLLKEANGAAQRGGVKFIAEIGNHAKAGIVGQIGATEIQHALQQCGGDQRKRDDGPYVVEVFGDEGLELDVTSHDGDGKQWKIASLRSGIQHLVEDGADEQQAEGIQQSYQGHRDHRCQQVEPIGLEVSEKAV